MIFPLISEIVTGQMVTVGPPFYKRATTPLFILLLFLMGIAPLTAWGHSTAKTIGRNVWKPALVSLGGILIFILFGIRDITALLGLGMVILTILIIGYEIILGVLARHKRLGENYLKAVWRIFGRNRRRYGGYVIHIGVVLMALGIIGIEVFQTQTQATIPQGGKMILDGYTMTYNSLLIFDTMDGRNVARAVVGIYKNDVLLGELHPRRDYYYDSQQPMTIPGVYSTWEDDFYVILVDWLPISSQGATFKIYHNPLVVWLWVGGFVFILGTLFASFPERERGALPNSQG
jgi:cytochrome c-type biogenesis protein CcmF